VGVGNNEIREEIATRKKGMIAITPLFIVLIVDYGVFAHVSLSNSSYFLHVISFFNLCCISGNRTMLMNKGTFFLVVKPSPFASLTKHEYYLYKSIPF
jgi:hypothetical protein